MLDHVFRERATSDLPLDKVVFGVTAVIAVAFLHVGLPEHGELSTASTSALDWTMQYLGWFFVLVASGFVVFALWLALGQYGNIPRP